MQVTFLKYFVIHLNQVKEKTRYQVERNELITNLNTFIYTGPRFWNILDNDIKNVCSLNSFKSKLKSFSSSCIVIPTQIDIVILYFIVH